MSSNGSNLNVRKGLGTNYDIIVSLNKNTKITILSTDLKWYKVKYNNNTGYMHSDYIKIS